MPAKTAPKTKKTASKAVSPKSKVSQESRYLKLRTQIESMKELHAIVLVIMVSLIAAMFLLMAKQKRQIDELHFKVDFLQDRYEFFRNQTFQAIEAKQLEADKK